MSLAATEPLQSGQTGPVPVLSEPFDSAQRHATGDETPRAGTTANTDESHDSKKKKRSLFGFGRKKTDDAAQSPAKLTSTTTTKASASTTPTANPTTSAAPSSSPPTTTTTTTTTTATTATPRRTAASPINIDATHKMMPSSPRRNLSSSSPRLVSPSGSQIFERDVTVLVPNSPAIPSHMQTENYIPPVLDASSEAITDDHLDPDSVEIITHTSHQPAASGLSLHDPPASATATSTTWADELASSFAERDFGLGLASASANGTDAHSVSNYGSLENSADIRRLSFISFADVVQAEQGTGAPGANHRDSMHLAGLTSIPSSAFPGLATMSGNRSPSPIRSPVGSSSGGGGPSPPTSKSGSVRGGGGVETSPGLSPARKPLGSPTASSHHMGLGGELNVETMTQALRRTGSGDMGVHRSIPVSPVEAPSR